MRPHLRSGLRDGLLITAGGLILAANINLFLVPAQIAPGGVSGAAIEINHFTGWPIGLTMLALNIPLIVVGYHYLGRGRFLVRTLFAVLVYNVGADVMAPWLPARGVTDDLILNALYAGVLGGLGTGLVYLAGGTTAGSGTLSRVVQIKTGIPISQVYLIVDGGIILTAGVIFGWEMGLYALITLFVWGLAADYIQEGPSVVRMAFIVTDAPEQVACALLNKLQIGVTAWPAEGMFTRGRHTVLFCTISRPHERMLREIVEQADRSAFIVTGHGHQATGGKLGEMRRR